MRLPSIGFKLKYFIIIMSVAAIILGGWVQFFNSKGFIKTTGTIVSIEEKPGAADDETDYTVTVAFTLTLAVCACVHDVHAVIQNMLA